MNSLTGPSLQGINRAFQGIRRVAASVAVPQKPPAESTDLSRTLVELKPRATQIKASSKALKQIDQAIGTLFDERA
jgi:hypothetical protein